MTAQATLSPAEHLGRQAGDIIAPMFESGHMNFAAVHGWNGLGYIFLNAAAGTVPFNYSAVQVLADAASIIGFAQVSVRDAAVNIASQLDQLQSISAAITSIGLTDSGTPTLSITAAQSVRDHGLINKINEPFALIVAAISGNNTQMGSQGNDTLIGGPGNDTAVFIGNVTKYTVTRSGSSFLVADKIAGVGGTDTLSNIEHIQFSDRSVNLTMASEASKVSASQLNSLTELYVAYFNRVPEASGLSYWIDKLAGGESLAQISQEFYAAGVAFSSFSGYSANMTNAAFTTIVYANVLGRTGSTAPSAADLAYWDNQISTGATTKEGLIQRMLSDAHTFAGDPTWGWVTKLLDNKVTVGQVAAVQLGVDYNSPTDAITQTVAISHAVTSTDTTAAINLIGLNDNVHLT